MRIIDINGTERTCLKAFPDPDYPGYMRVEFKNHHEWFTIKEFLSFNPDLKSLTTSVPDLPDDDLGVVSSSGKDFIKDTKKNWKENSYLDFTLWISRGLGEGQKGQVVKNSHNTVYISTPWKIKPNKSSQYVLSHNIHDVPARGNTLPAYEQEQLEKMALGKLKKKKKGKVS